MKPITGAPAVTIIIPAYNAQASIRRALDSVTVQDFSDYEVIVVDDGSTDATRDTVEEYLRHRRDNRFHLLALEHNRGQSAARNAGLDKARGTFITFLDADDECLPGFLSTLLGRLDAETDIVIGGHLVYAAGRRPRPRHSKFLGSTTGEEAVRLAMTDRILPFNWDRIFRRSLFDGMRYPEGSASFEDGVMNIALFARARRVVSIPAPVYRYHISANSLTWSTLLTEADTGLAMEFLERFLPAAYRLGRNRAYYESLQLLLLMIVANSAVMKSKKQELVRQSIAGCRRSITTDKIRRVARVQPFLAAGALLFKLAPAPYRNLYRWYVKRGYGLEG